MKRPLLAALFVSLSAVAGVVGCNAILGNEAGVLASSDASLGSDAPGVTDSGPVQPTDAGGCASGEKECGGVCVNVTDPSVGCGGECNPCKQLDNGASKCGLSDDTWVCTLGDCTSGYADCDHKPADGCESSLSGKHSCGSCAVDCPEAGLPFCDPGNGTTGPSCSLNCAHTNCCGNAACTNPNDPKGECVDLADDSNNCGGCGHTCMGQFPNATDAVCSGGACKFTTCAAGYAKCSGGTGGAQCVVDTNKKCGASCTDCTATANPVCDSMTGTCKSCGMNKVFCGSDGPNGSCDTEDNTHCGPGCASCGNGQHCDTGMHACVNDPAMCSGQLIACPPSCVGVPGACSGGCLDPTKSPFCGGDCSGAGDCTMAATPRACCSSANGSGAPSYACQDFDAGDDDAGLPPSNCMP